MALYSTTMRYTGLSGIDTQSMVEAMMRAESIKYDNLKKTRQKTTWRNEAYKAHATAINAFRSSFLDMTSATSIRRSAVMNSTTAKVSTAAGADSKAVTVRTSDTTLTGTYSLNIQQLAQADTYQGSKITTGTIAGSSSFNAATDLREGDNINVTLNGRTVTFKFGGSDGINISSNSAFQASFNAELKRVFGDDANGQAKVSVDTAGGQLAFKTNGNNTLRLSEANGRAIPPITGAAFNVAADPPLIAEGTELSFKIGDADIKFKYGKDIGETINNIRTAMSEAGVSNVSVGYNGTSFEFITLGSTEAIHITGSDLTKLGFAASNTFQPTSVLNTRMGIDNNASTAFNRDVKLSDSSLFNNFNNGDKFKVNGQEFTVDKNMTIREFENMINNSGAGVRLSYDSISESYRLEATSTGAVNAIKFEGAAVNVFSSFRLSVDDASSDARSAALKAQDSMFVLNGQTFIRDDNNVTVGSLGLTLNEVTDPGRTNSAGTAITIEVSRNTDAVFDVIKGFVEAYNSLIDSLNGAVNQNRARTGTYSYYEPLTDNEKSSMSDSAIQQWEAKAKEGILTRDQTLSSFTARMRTELYQPVTLADGRQISLFEIGITTSSNVSEQGKLVIDEDKLRSALENRGKDVADLFTMDGGTAKTTGLAERLNKAVDSVVGLNGSLTRIVGSEFYASTLTNNSMFHLMKAQDNQLADLLTYLRNREDHYYMMFSKMETAVQNANSQMSYLQSMLGM